MILPSVNRLNKREARIVSMGGLNFTDDYKQGALASCMNMSARRYPYMASRNPRLTLEGYENCTAVSSWNELVTVRHGLLYYGARRIGTVQNGPKQFAMVNTKLVIWPDKVYLDLPTMTIKPLAAEVTATSVTFTENSITMTGVGDLREIFTTGDGLIITGCMALPHNNRYRDNPATVKTVSPDTLTFTLTDQNKFTPGDETVPVTFERPVPDLDYICESENRLWGVSNADKTIYASALGDPCTFFDYSGEATDSFAVAVGSAGDFTGCNKLSSSVCFWKENTLHKMLGSYPAEYQLYTYEFEGVKSGCNKSIVLLNERMYYVGTRGVYQFAGASPSLVSKTLGDIDWDNAVGGTDGNTIYYAAEVNGEQRMFTLDMATGIWLEEEDFQGVYDFTRIGNDLFYAEKTGLIRQVNAGEHSYDFTWQMTFKPVFETVSGAYNSSALIFAKKKYSKLILRLDLPAGSKIQAMVKHDNGPWVNCGEKEGPYENLCEMVIPINRCDKFELHLFGHGPCTVLNMVRMYLTGSAR